MDSEYILQTDNDIIVNMDLLVESLKNFKSGFTGKLAKNAKLSRGIYSNNYIPLESYLDKRLIHVWGRGYVFTKNVKNPLVEALDQYKGVFLDFEQVFSGMIAFIHQFALWHSHQFALWHSHQFALWHSRREVDLF